MSIMHAAQATHPLFHFIPTIPDQLTYVGSDREDEEAQYTWKNSPTTRTGGLEITQLTTKQGEGRANIASY
eukprot:scaffold4912_cov100-Skeletonema_marinoi.AAC.8